MTFSSNENRRTVFIFQTYNHTLWMCQLWCLPHAQKSLNELSLFIDTSERQLSAASLFLLLFIKNMSIADWAEQMPKAKGGKFMGCWVICDLALYQRTSWTAQVVFWQFILRSIDIIRVSQPLINSKDWKEIIHKIKRVMVELVRLANAYCAGVF